MVFGQKKYILRWLIIIVSVVVLCLFLWSVLLFFEQLKNEEQTKMEIWVEAQTELINDSDPDAGINPVLFSVIEKNTTTPMILYSVTDQLYEAKNISRKNLTQKDLAALAKTFRQHYEPIEIYHDGELYEVVFYGNSSFITKAKYSPLAIILVILLFSAILYYFYSISKSNEQNKLWAGMAKETAHQIGTPLSSLVGWIEILKEEQVNPDYLLEMEKDVSRLKVITDRFSKIGSHPTLIKTDLTGALTETHTYLTKRLSKLIEFTMELPDKPIYVMLNTPLLSWTIENLIKNAADAMKGKGKITITLKEDSSSAVLWVSDTGKGIPKTQWKRIFKPGETTKRRGWGLGLSLAKRIVEEYHRGRIKVLRSEKRKGTTFEIRLRKL